MRSNTVVRNTLRTHEGAMAHPINAEQQLRRAVMACLLWENTFYESGQDIATRIAELVPQVKPEVVATMAIEARQAMNLRHVPLLLVREMCRHQSHKPYVKGAIEGVVQRADEPAELLALLWKDGRCHVPHAVRDGLDVVLRRFDEYQLAKYKGERSKVKLRDVFRVIRPKPDNATQSEMWKRVVTQELMTPDTWETALSASDGVSKHDKWARLLRENKLGALALLRNLRNMEQEGVDRLLVAGALGRTNVSRVLPFRFIAAARYAPHLEPVLEDKMFESLEGKPKLPGTTAIVVDISPSMYAQLSSKSDMTRQDAACGVAMVGRELCEDVEVYAFSTVCGVVPPRRGFALRDAIIKAVPTGGTSIGNAVNYVYEARKGRPLDRLIVITDEQSRDRVPDPQGKGYMINVATYRNGVGYGKWTHVDGFSEAVFNYIYATEIGNGSTGMGDVASMETDL